ncbi:MAG: hypothetical protein ACRDAU_18935 [Clostridium sp.]
MKFLYGRYGIDIFSIFLLFLSSILNLFRYTHYIGLIILILIIFRALSKNKYKRNEENIKFITLINKFLKKFNKQLPYNMPTLNFDSLAYFKQAYSIYKTQKNIKKEQNKNFKILTCPNCGQKLRVPKGKKKIVVTCSRCKKEFKAKS